MLRMAILDNSFFYLLAAVICMVICFCSGRAGL